MSAREKDERRSELLMHLISRFSRSLEGNGVTKDRAIEIAISISDDLCKEFGGELIYIPKNKDHNTMLMQHAIFKEFNGTNQSELGRKYNISITHVYRVLKKLQHERQPSLF
jgi:Mor family transcriptional regulator